jgi:alginate O-acetyltransferase complex protein AlgJ
MKQRRPHLQTREEQAAAEIGHTRFDRGTKALCLAVLIAIVGAVPLLDLLIPRHAPGEIALSARPTEARSRLHFPTAPELQALGKQLESASRLHSNIRPAIQSLLTTHLGIGSHQAILARDNWLFYRPDIEHLTGPPFLNPAQLAKRRQSPGTQPDPLAAIRDLHRQLRARNIQLVIVPVPSKGAIASRHLTDKPTTHAENPSYQYFLDTLKGDGIASLDLRSLFLSHQAAHPKTELYLRTDTHWTPQAVQLAASNIAALIAPNSTADSTPTVPLTLTHRGDLVPMLGADSETSSRFEETAHIEQVTRGSGLWRPDSTADVLLLGDSFANIFSLNEMGWGESAGLAEHLSRAVNRPIDAITRNSDGAFATREMLAAQLARGHDRLAGKRWVVWTFAERELSFGNWKLIPIEAATRPSENFLELTPGATASFTATIAAVSHVPRPNSVAYPDHLCSVHLVDITPRGASPAHPPATSAIVLTWSMRNRIWTDAARWRPGDRVSIKARPWSELEPSLGKINQSTLEDPALLAVEPLWGDVE